MKNSTADYIATARLAFGSTSDTELGERLGEYAEPRTVYSQPMVAKAKAGNASDPFCMALAAALNAKGVKVDAGEILLVARAEREKDERVRDALLAYAKKVLASVPSKAVAALGAMAVALGMMLQPPEVQAAGIGGDGGF